VHHATELPSKYITFVKLFIFHLRFRNNTEFVYNVTLQLTKTTQQLSISWRPPTDANCLTGI